MRGGREGAQAQAQAREQAQAQARRRSLLAFAFLGLASCAEFHAAPPPGAPKETTFADVDGVKLRFVERGAGPAVVMIHGFASSLETWDAVAPVLARDHRVLMLDLKGFGWSGRPEGDYSPDAEAKLVLDLMAARGIEKADVVAHSWGSSVALAMAIAKPAAVRKIALYDAWVYEAQLPTFFLWARGDGIGEALFTLFYKERADEKMTHAFFDPERWVTQPLVDAVERSLEFPGTVAAALAAVRGQRFTDVEGRYSKITQETLLLWGREDQVTLLEYGERLSRDLPHARLVTYPRCGHFPMIEAANASTEDLVSFLGKGPSTSHPEGDTK